MPISIVDAWPIDVQNLDITNAKILKDGSYQRLVDIVDDPQTDALAGLSPAADTVPYFTSATTAATTGLTAFARTLIGNATASEARLDLALAEYETVALAAAVTVPSDINYVRTAHYSSTKTGGGGLYKRKASEPTHTAKFQSADGTWWELVPEHGRVHAFQVGGDATVNASGVSSTAVFDNAVAAAIALGVRHVYFPRGSYYFKTKPAAITYGVVLSGDHISHTIFERNYTPGFNTEPFIDYTGANEGGGGITGITLRAITGTTGTSLRLIATSNANKPSYFWIGVLNCTTSGGGWYHNLFVDGTAAPASGGSPGLRDLTIGTAYLFGASNKALYLYHVRNVHALYLYGDSGALITGGTDPNSDADEATTGVRVAEMQFDGQQLDIDNSQLVFLNSSVFGTTNIAATAKNVTVEGNLGTITNSCTTCDTISNGAKIVRGTVTFSGDVDVTGALTGSSTVRGTSLTGTSGVVSSDSSAGAGAMNTRRLDAHGAADIGYARGFGMNSTPAEIEYTRTVARVLDNTAGSEASEIRWQTRNAGTLAQRGAIGQGLVIGSPTGGDKGVGTVNATAVYDDNVLLTDYVFDRYLGVVPPGGYGERVARLAEALDPAMFDPASYADFWLSNRRLWGMPTLDDYADGEVKAVSLGGMIQKIWQTVELQAIHIEALRRKLEGR